MPRAIWKGAVTFGLVTIPVKLHVATEHKDLAFNMLHAEDNVRIKQQRYCPEHDRVLDLDEIVKGFEIAPSQYVVLTEEDFEKVPVKSTRNIEITDFVQAEEIDPIYYERAYYLEPEATAMKPFALLRKTLIETNRVAVANIAFRQREHLCTLRPFENTIALETMLFADEIRSSRDLELPSEEMEISDRELEMARTLVDMLSGQFDPQKYHDSYREALLELVRAKSEGLEIAAPEPMAPKVTDLMQALRASIEEAKKERRGAGEKAARPLRKKAG